MTPRFRHTVSIVLLSVYIPLAIFVEVLHTHDAWGHGPATVQQATLTGTADDQTAGVCLSCLFSAGHCVQPDVVLPSTPARIVGSFVTVAQFPQAPSQLLSSRGPPSYPC